MKISRKVWFVALLSTFLSAGILAANAEDKANSQGKVPLELKLPTPGFKGTPKDIQLSPYVEPLSDKPRPPMMVPPGLKSVIFFHVAPLSVLRHRYFPAQ